MSAQQHNDLARVSNSVFEMFFDADLREDQYRGALWILAGSMPLDEFYTVVGDLEDVLEDAGIDVAAVRAAAASWEESELQPGVPLPGPVTRCYSVQLAM